MMVMIDVVILACLRWTITDMTQPVVTVIHLFVRLRTEIVRLLQIGPSLFLGSHVTRLLVPAWNPHLGKGDRPRTVLRRFLVRDTQRRPIRLPSQS